MRNINEKIAELLISLGSEKDLNTQAQREAIVYTKWKNTVEFIYKDISQMVLSHINAVYVMKSEEVKKSRHSINISKKGTVLVIYCDDSMIRSDLDSRQDFLKMKFNEQGEYVEAFAILPSQFDMKTRKPYQISKEDVYLNSLSSKERKSSSRELLPEEEKLIENQVSVVENKQVREALKKAMISNLEHKKE